MTGRVRVLTQESAADAFPMAELFAALATTGSVTAAAAVMREGIRQRGETKREELRQNGETTRAALTGEPAPKKVEPPKED